MIVPSIDLMNGHAVQLVGGKEMKLDAGDPRPIAEKFGVVGEIAVVDLDAALKQGSNAEAIEELLRIAPCRVGGGIRDVATATKWLDAGADKIVIGTAAEPEFLRQFPKHRLIAALDAVDGEVVVEGWRTKTGRAITERMAELRDYVGGFLVTFVEREGRMQGTDMGRVKHLVEAAHDARLTIAGGVTTPAEIAELDALGADAQVGMALYTDHMNLAEAFFAPMKSDRPDGLLATVVCDEHGTALGLAWSSRETLREAIETRRGVYHSRSRGRWIKGETSGATQELLRVAVDCDRDALRFTVRQHGPGFCHENTATCWGDAHGLPTLAKTLKSRLQSAPTGSYTRRLLDDPDLLGKKLAEEAAELATATTAKQVAEETADVIYFALVAMVRGGANLAEVERILDRRSRKITRRPGDAKPSSP